MNSIYGSHLPEMERIQQEIQTCIDALRQKMKEESGCPQCKVVATGGFGKMIADETDVIDYYDPHLTLKGLRIIHEKQRK